MLGGILVKLNAVVELAEEIMIVKGIGPAFVDLLAHFQGQVGPLILQMAPGQIQGGLGVLRLGGQLLLQLGDQGQVPLPEPVGDLLHEKRIVAADVHHIVEGLLSIEKLTTGGLAFGNALKGLDMLRIALQDPADQWLGIICGTVLDQQHGIIQGQGVILGPLLRQLPEDGHGFLPALLEQKLLGPEDPAIGMALRQAFQPLHQRFTLLRGGLADLIVEAAVGIAGLCIPAGLKLLIGQAGLEADTVDNAIVHEFRRDQLPQLLRPFHPGKGGVQRPPNGPGQIVMLHQKPQQGLLGLGPGIQCGADGIIQKRSPAFRPDAACKIIIKSGNSGTPATQGAVVDSILLRPLLSQAQGLLISSPEGLEFLGLVLGIRGPQLGRNAQNRPIHSLQSFLFLSLRLIITYRCKKYKKKEPDVQALFQLKISVASSITRTMGIPVVSRKYRRASSISLAFRSSSERFRRAVGLSEESSPQERDPTGSSSPSFWASSRTARSRSADRVFR